MIYAVIVYILRQGLNGIKYNKFKIQYEQKKVEGLSNFPNKLNVSIII